jgi:hypothetical protein
MRGLIGRLNTAFIERAPLIIVCDLMQRYGWRSCSRESGVANFLHNVSDSELQPWQSGERIDAGPCGKSCVIPCRQHNML